MRRRQEQKKGGRGDVSVCLSETCTYKFILCELWTILVFHPLSPSRQLDWLTWHNFSLSLSVCCSVVPVHKTITHTWIGIWWVELSWAEWTLCWINFQDPSNQDPPLFCLCIITTLSDSSLCSICHSPFNVKWQRMSNQSISQAHALLDSLFGNRHVWQTTNNHIV